jgi:hypothetical protein
VWMGMRSMASKCVGIGEGDEQAVMMWHNRMKLSRATYGCLHA